MSLFCIRQEISYLPIYLCAWWYIPGEHTHILTHHAMNSLNKGIPSRECVSLYLCHISIDDSIQCFDHSSILFHAISFHFMQVNGATTSATPLLYGKTPLLWGHTMIVSYSSLCQSVDHPTNEHRSRYYMVYCAQNAFIDFNK